MSGIKFGTVISAVGEPGASDADQYVEALVDADRVAGLGYDAFWVIEHHFSDYFPTPSPTVMLSPSRRALSRHGLRHLRPWSCPGTARSGWQARSPC